MPNQRNSGVATSQAYSDAQYFAAHPGDRFRFCLRGSISETGCFAFEAKTRGGGCLSGDNWDLSAVISNFRKGTRRERLLRALRLMALRQVHRVKRGAPDLICGTHCTWDGSGFGTWAASHG